MAQGLYICATRPYSGKNMLAMGLGLRLQKDGFNVGYMKPIGAIPTEKNGLPGDEDAFFIQEVLGLDLPADLVTPVLVTQDFKMRAFSGQCGNLMPGIARAYATISQGRDVMVVAGSGHVMSGRYCGLDGLRLVRELGLKAVLVDRLEHEINYDLLLSMKEIMGEHLLGVVLNDIPPAFMTEITSVIRPFLESRQVSVLGVIPRDPLMGSIRAHELADRLGGRLVAAQGRADAMVENFLIGTMQVENFMNYFRKQKNSAVIVGGDRADVQLVAIEGECPCLVLTGNLFPNDIILSRADTLNVPIIMVRDDTYTVAKKMEALLSRHKMRDVIKIRQGAQLVSANLDFDAIRSGLGI